MAQMLWKYNLNYHLTFLQMPKGAIIRSVQMQGDKPVMWVEVETANEREFRTFNTFETGEELRNTDKYIATVQRGSYVFHVYEVKEPEFPGRR